ncbi:hypothetical protein I3760_05G132900 [Carya illinoinensis]|nr:hypothetical protein I3760_05G132900 [Carya illinoinensis]
MQKILLHLIFRTAAIGIVFLRHTMTESEVMDCLAIRRRLYCLFQICPNVSPHWKHGKTNGLLTRRLLLRERGNLH